MAKTRDITMNLICVTCVRQFEFHIKFIMIRGVYIFHEHVSQTADIKITETFEVTLKFGAI